MKKHTRASTLILFACAVPLSAAPSGTACPDPARTVLAGATRLVVGTTADWNALRATWRTFERASATEKWRASGPARPAVIGKSGMAWGFPYASLAAAGAKSRDLPGTGGGPAGAEPVKHEGDGRTPAGIFRFGRKFGFASGGSKNDLAIDARTACVDDVASRFYNQIVEENQVAKDWKSAEMMRQVNQYKIGFVVDYPSDARARAGSCIFVHIWNGPDAGTSGCLASAEENIADLQGWIDDTASAAVAFFPEKTLKAWLGCLPGVASTEPTTK